MKKVFLNGTFDVIHLGHLQIINYAKSLGDYLLIAIDTDRRVKELKGESRPINSYNERKVLLENLKAVDEVQPFDSESDLISILIKYKPDIIVKGGDHRHTSKLAKQYCDEVVFYDRFGDYSSTKKIQDIIDR